MSQLTDITVLSGSVGILIKIEGHGGIILQPEQARQLIDALQRELKSHKAKAA